MIVQVSDGVIVDTQTLSVSVADLAEGIALTDVVPSIRRNEGDPFILIDADVTFTGPNAGYAGTTLTVAGGTVPDELTVLNGAVDVEGPTISFAGVPIGLLSGGFDGQPLVVTFNAAATRAAIEAVIQSLAYRSNSDIPVQPHSLGIQVRTSTGVTTGSVVVNVTFVADVLNGTVGADSLSGRRGNDTINGFEGNDFLDGGVGDDTLFGGDGDDFLVGGLNNNTLDGGLSDDTAVYTGARADYIFFQGQQGEFVVGQLDGQGQLILRDSLFDIEFLQFSDGTFTVGVIFGSPKLPPDKGSIQVCFGGPEDDTADKDQGAQTLPAEPQDAGKAENDPLVLPGLEDDAATLVSGGGGDGGGSGSDAAIPFDRSLIDWIREFEAHRPSVQVSDPDWLL